MRCMTSTYFKPGNHRKWLRCNVIMVAAKAKRLHGYRL
jgi:hypothetical protein